MGIFLRQSYKQKPKQWGPFSAVQAAVFHNADKMGIDPPVSILPFWEQAGTKCYDYMQCYPYTTPAGQNYPTYQDNTIVFNNNAIAVDTNLAAGFSAVTTFFDVFVGDTGARKDLFFCSTSSASYTMFRITFENDEDLTVGIRSQESDSQAIYASSGTGATYFRDRWANLAVRVCLVSDRLDIFVGGKQIGGANLSLSLNTFADEVVNKWIGMRPDGNYPFEGKLRQFQSYGYALPDDKIAYLSDNPYQLCQPVPQKTYFQPQTTGDESLLPINVSAMSVVGKNFYIITDRAISIDKGNISTTGNDITVEYGNTIEIIKGIISYTGKTFSIGKAINITAGAITVTGKNLLTGISSVVSVVVGSISMVGKNFKINRVLKIIKGLINYSGGNLTTTIGGVAIVISRKARSWLLNHWRL